MTACYDTAEERIYRALVEIPAPQAQDPSCVSSTRRDVEPATHPICVAKKKHKLLNKGRMIPHSGTFVPPFIHIHLPLPKAIKRDDGS